MSEHFELAGRGRRLGATLIDAVLVPSLSIVLIMAAGVLEDAEDYANNWWMLWVLLLAIVSYLILNGYWLWQRGQTVGKRLLGIAIASTENADAKGDAFTPAPLWRLIAIRAWFFPLLFLIVVPWVLLIPIVDQLLIFGKRKRCLHDLIAKTQVVRLPSEQRIAN
ncbi:MAG: RDD family protein [Pseudomonadales bacterium]